MARILFAWELGAGYGHLAGIAPLAARLQAMGHDVLLAVRDLQHAEQLLEPAGLAYTQAPVWLRGPPNLPDAANFAEVLLTCGYAQADGLAALIRAWRRFYALYMPDLLIADYAPTALLGARGTDIRRAAMGNGFMLPPRQTPMPAIHPWVKIPQQRLVESETRVLRCTNEAAERVGIPRLETLGEIFDVEERFLCTFPELDHYPTREPATYWGPRFAADEGVSPTWPQLEGPRLLVYVPVSHALREPLFEVLHSLGYPCLLHIPGIEPARVRRFRCAHLYFSARPVQMAAAAADCDLVISHAGHGTVAHALLAGRPSLLLPSQLEQAGLAQVVSDLGAGLMVKPGTERPPFKKLIRRLLDEGSFHEQARLIAAQHRDFDHERQTEAMAARCQTLLET